MSSESADRSNVIVKLVSVVTDGLARSKIIITREDMDNPTFYKANERKKCEFHKVAMYPHYRELLSDVIGPTTGTIATGSAIDFIDNKYTGSRPTIPYYKDFISCLTALFLTNKHLTDYKISYTKNSSSSYICHVEIVKASDITESDYNTVKHETRGLYRMMTGEAVTDNTLSNNFANSLKTIDKLREQLKTASDSSEDVQKYKEGYEVYTLIRQIINKTADK